MTNRLALAAFAVLVATAACPDHAAAYESVSAGGKEGEIDVNAQFSASLGRLEPTERPTTWQDANTKMFNLGAGYTVGRAGPLMDLYLRLDGGYFIAKEESIESSEDDLEQGYQFYGEDKGGFVSGTLAANFVRHPRFNFGAFLRGTVPINVQLKKFSSVHLHFMAGGVNLGVAITEADGPITFAYRSQLFVGSGAYDGDFQHNAALALSNLFVLGFERWLLPWPAGLGLGPYMEADINEHTSFAYHDAYARVTNDYVKGDRIRQAQLAIAVLPYIHVTDHAVIELAWVPRLFGIDSQTTQLFSGGLRTTF